MGSGIILVRRYITESTFGHYFEPIFESKGISITDRHFSGELSDEERALLALKGDVNKCLIYDVMTEGVGIAKRDIEDNDFRRMHHSERPEWCHLYPDLIDNRPEIIGIYSGDETASRFFESVGLKYIVKDIEGEVFRDIESMRFKLKTLGSDFSKL